MKKLLISLILLQLPVLALNTEEAFKEDWAKGSAAYDEPNLPLFTAEGVYIDGRGQVPKYSRISPPHPENIPGPRAVHTIEPYDSYYQAQILGKRRPPDKDPLVAGHNVHYSTRTVNVYRLREYLDVWCASNKDYSQDMCSTKDYDIYFVHANAWAARMVTLPFKIRKARAKGHKVGLFLCVDFIGRDSEDVVDAKRFAQLWDLPIFAATIDSYLPMDFYVD